MERKTYTSEEIKEKLRALPGHVQDFIYSEEIDAAVQKIGQKNQLHIDQMGLLQAEVTDVMIGTTEPNDFVPYMIETLEIDQTKAEAIAKDANEMLFEKIRQAMRDGTPLTSTTSSTQPRVTPAATPVPTTPTAPKREFPAADVMLTQKTVTAPISASGSSPAHEATIVVPPKLVPMTTMPPAISKAPGTFVTTPAQAVPPAPRVAPPLTTLSPKIPSSTSPTLATAPIAPTQPLATPISPASISPAPTPESAVPTSPTPPTPAQNPYKTDPYREPIE